MSATVTMLPVLMWSDAKIELGEYLLKTFRANDACESRLIAQALRMAAA